jgi:hypothetical protein
MAVKEGKTPQVRGISSRVCLVKHRLVLQPPQDYCLGGTTTMVLPPVPVLPVFPVLPVLPLAPVDPVFPVLPVAPVAPVFPVLPWLPASPVAPVYPVLPVLPWFPVAPTAPVAPVYPVFPVFPWLPASPCAPVYPVFPVLPCGPIGPVHAPSPSSATSRSDDVVYFISIPFGLAGCHELDQPDYFHKNTEAQETLPAVGLHRSRTRGVLQAHPAHRNCTGMGLVAGALTAQGGQTIESHPQSTLLTAPPASPCGLQPPFVRTAAHR